jgi:hypothetical protein
LRTEESIASSKGRQAHFATIAEMRRHKGLFRLSQISAAFGNPKLKDVQGIGRIGQLRVATLNRIV